jgi:hypothetical protein
MSCLEPGSLSVASIRGVECSHLHMGSLPFNNMGAAGARDLGGALQVNTTLTELG